MRKLAIFWIATLVAYLMVVGAMYAFQRKLMYFPDGSQGPAAKNGLPKSQTLDLKTSDGEHVVAWYQAPNPGRPLFLFFHGNGGNLAIRSFALKALADDGSDFLAIDYRGYGGSTGSPSEAGFLLDAEAVRLGNAPDTIVALGESLGTGVAVAVAARHPVRALVLDSAYDSTLDVARGNFPFVPVSLLMRDTFDSASRIKSVKAPTFFAHGTADTVVPIVYGRRLYDTAPQPKTFVEIENVGHNVLWIPQVLARMREWLSKQPQASTPDLAPRR